MLEKLIGLFRKKSNFDGAIDAILYFHHRANQPEAVDAIIRDVAVPFKERYEKAHCRSSAEQKRFVDQNISWVLPTVIERLERIGINRIWDSSEEKEHLLKFVKGIGVYAVSEVPLSYYTFLLGGVLLQGAKSPDRAIQCYAERRDLATVGTTTFLYFHECNHSIDAVIQESANSAREQLRTLGASEFEEQFRTKTGIVGEFIGETAGHMLQDATMMQRMKNEPDIAVFAGEFIYFMIKYAWKSLELEKKQPPHKMDPYAYLLNLRRNVPPFEIGNKR